ncbi:MAG: hypothetical protein J7K82_06580 [Thermoproteales archaeon]|nr:hypothetical protein [Thermoproteales archaeon]
MRTVKKAVITAGGLGTRLLPSSKEIPKEMFPIYDLDHNGNICLKPVVHKIFENIYDIGIRQFCFIVGRGKRSIEDHFTPDKLFAKLIREKGLDEKYVDLRMFYDKILESRIFFINQPEPKGFGDAVLRAEGFVGDDPFLLHAGDDLVLSDNTSHLRNLINTFNELRGDVTLLVEWVEDPRSYGVILPRKIQGYSHIFKIEDIVEKPKKPPSNYAVVGIYILNKKIFETLKDIGPDSKGELQLTTAIRQIIKSGGEGYAVMLDEGESRLDVGNPFNYYKALNESFKFCLSRSSRK